MERKCEVCGKTDDNVYNWFIYAPSVWKDGYRTCDPNGQIFFAHKTCAARVEEKAWMAFDKVLTEAGIRLG